MRKVNRERKKHPLRFIYSPKFLAFLGVVVLMVISVPLVESLNQKQEVEQEISDIKKEISRLESKNKNLDKLADYLGSEQFVEEQARLNFDMKKKGEKVVVVKEEGKVAGASTSSTGRVGSTRNSDRSNPGKWADYFFKK